VSVARLQACLYSVRAWSRLQSRSSMRPSKCATRPRRGSLLVAGWTGAGHRLIGVAGHDGDAGEDEVGAGTLRCGLKGIGLSASALRAMAVAVATSPAANLASARSKPSNLCGLLRTRTSPSPLCRIQSGGRDGLADRRPCRRPFHRWYRQTGWIFLKVCSCRRNTGSGQALVMSWRTVA